MSLKIRTQTRAFKVGCRNNRASHHSYPYSLTAEGDSRVATIGRTVKGAWLSTVHEIRAPGMKSTVSVALAI